ncbi:MAG: tetratricopeptide repeat protein [Fibrella sp.]|nr:tetratricopeptide repeat protein [Armatimonadota bacterium]
MLWRIELFGGLRAYSGDHTITRFQTYKTGALLAYLAYFCGRRHPREELINILWPDVDPTSARNRLSQALVWLRPRLEPTDAARNSVLFTDRHCIGLHQDAIQTDSAQLEISIQSASHTFPHEQIPVLRSATDLYNGELLAGFYEDWIFPERQRYARTYLDILRRLIGLYEVAQDFDRALDYARRALTADPLMEEVHGDLIRVLARSGQSAAALRQYHELEKILAENLGEAPSAEIRSLIEEIRGGTSYHPPIASSERRRSPSKLPAPLTRFFGRKHEIAHVQQIIVSDQMRLVTLVGPGGCGKTRLATEIVSHLKESYEGDIWFVPLVDVHDAQRIPHMIADVIRTPAPSPLPVLEQVIEWLAWRPSLLVLDNLEHLIEGVAPLIQELLERIPSLTILTTSRQCIGVEGEREVTVSPLPLPTQPLTNGTVEEAMDLEYLMRCESIQLFVDRIQAVHPAFRLDTNNAQAVVQICNRLEGIPLATELCAAWAQTLTPSQMLEELARPFDLLVSRRREVPTRHRSLRTAIEYSYHQLTPTQQQFFNRLSIFRSGWTLEAAEAVCLNSGDVDARQRKTQARDLLTGLRDRSLVTTEEVGNVMRFRMLETLREFSAEQQATSLLDQQSIRRQHAEYFMRLAESTEASLIGPEQLDRINRLSADHDNLRAALGWAIETKEAEIGLRLAGALTPFWDARGFLGEGQHWLMQVLRLPDTNKNSRENRLIRAKALTARGNLARNQGNFPGVDAAMQEAIQIWRECESEKGTAEALQILATIAYSHDDSKTARNYLHEGLLLARRLQDRLLMALALHNLGNIALANRQWKKAFSYYTESLTLYRVEGNRNRSARILNNLGLVARYQNDYKTALAHLHEALETSRELSDRSGMAMTSLNLATINRLEGHFTSAVSFLNEAVRYAVEAGEQRLLPWCVRERGYLICAQGDYERGIRLIGAAENQRRTIGITFKPADPVELEQILSLACTIMGEERCNRLWAVGNSLPHTMVYAEALHLSETPPPFK